MLLTTPEYTPVKTKSTPRSKKFDKCAAFDQLVDESANLGATSLMTRVLPVDAELATHILKKYHVRNRKLSAGHVATLKHDIDNDNWKLSAQGIAINKEGHLDDGQHRLTAISQANKAVPMLVVFGSDPEAFSVYDSGRKRSSGDVLSILDVPSANNIAALATMVFQENSVGRVKVTSSDVLAFHEEYSEQAINAVHTMARLKNQGVPCSPAGLAMFAFKVERDSQHKKKLGDFVEKVATGVGLEKGSPELRLRSILQTRSIPWGSIQERFSFLNHCIYCWNASIVGKPVHSVRLPKNLRQFQTIDIA